MSHNKETLPLARTRHKALGIFNPLWHILERKWQEIVSIAYANHPATYADWQDVLLANRLGQRASVLGHFHKEILSFHKATRELKCA